MTSNRPVSEMVERVRDVFASYDLDDFNRWSDRGVELFTREIIKAASSQAPSDDDVERAMQKVRDVVQAFPQFSDDKEFGYGLNLGDLRAIAAIPSAGGVEEIERLRHIIREYVDPIDVEPADLMLVSAIGADDDAAYRATLNTSALLATGEAAATHLKTAMRYKEALIAICEKESGAGYDLVQALSEIGALARAALKVSGEE